jgi:hypothetical protein
VQHDPPAAGWRRVCLASLAQHREVAAHHPRRSRRVGEVDVRIREDDLDPAEPHQLAQLRGREGDVRGAAAHEHVHLLHVGRGERLQRVAGHVGGGELIGAPAQHACDVEGDVAGADHDRGAHPLRGDARAEGILDQGAVGVRVAAVPGDQRGGGQDAAQVLPGHVEAPVGGGTVGVDHRVHVLAQSRHRHVLADLHPAEEADVVAVQQVGEAVADAADLRMVRRDPVSQQAERGRQPVDHLDTDRDVGEVGQRLGGEQPRRAGSDDRDPERPDGHVAGGFVGGLGRRVVGLRVIGHQRQSYGSPRTQASGWTGRTAQVRDGRRCSSTSPIRPASSVRVMYVQCGSRRRSVGDPGLSRRRPSIPLSQGMWL